MRENPKRLIAYWLLCILIPTLPGAAILWLVSGLVARLPLDLVWTIALGAVVVTSVTGAIVSRLVSRRHNTREMWL